MPETIDFTKIRGNVVEGQRSVFEQLVCHLAKFDERGGEFRRIEGAGGDGGVEALRIHPSGRKIGYQAKFYTDRNQIGWSTLDDSVKTALTQHPELECYVIAIPCDFTGKRAARGGSTEGVWGKWAKNVEKWKNLATEKGMTVVFEPWTAFELEAALLKPNTQHLIRYFFDQLVFNREWMKRHLDRTIHDLQARYSPGEHVDTGSLKPFDVIYRRNSICQDLSSIFEIARNSNPRAAVLLVENADIPEAGIIAAENSIRDFLDLEKAISLNIDKSWPISDWLTIWCSMTRCLRDINNAIRGQIGAERTDGNALISKVAELTKAYELSGPEVFGGRWIHLLPIDGSRAVLFVGRAGAGKSHVLARGTEEAWNAGAPVIHILGQHILDDDPRESILKRLELIDWSFHEMLSALNLVAEATDTRAMFVIDALNEGRGTDVWRNHLSSFISEINQYDRITLVVSCREEYLDYVVPSSVIASPEPYPKDGQDPKDCSPLGKLVRISVNGFRTTEERENALQMFMDKKGIARPTAPVLDDEFYNPLFMSSVCRSMATAGIKVFPRGLRGNRDIFKFVLKTKAKSLGTRHDTTERIHPVLQATLSELVGIMVQSRNDYIPLREAVDVIESGFKTLPINPQTWLEVLEGADILRRDVEKPWKQADDWSRPNEVIRFSFQRLQDNLFAERLLCDCRNIEEAFEPNEPFAFLIKRSIQTDGTHLLKFNPRWVGVLAALWSAVAEQHKKELWDIKTFFGNPDIRLIPHEFQPVFHSSIRERPVTAFTQRTKDIFDKLWKDEPEEKMAIILSFACVPDHPWNADFLTTRLFKFTLADRDSKWSTSFISNKSAIVDRGSEIIDWSLNIDASSADTVVVRLAGLTLTWLFTVTNRTIRDRATKALVNLLCGSSRTFPYLLDLFHSVDDPYVLDRLLAAGYGANCLDPTDERITSSAKVVADTIFGETEPPIHLSIRDWAWSILKLAAERKLNPVDFDIERIRSSFGSTQPIFDINKDELAKITHAAGDNEIARSCQWGHDFFSYVISPEISDFSETPLTEPPPFTQDERADRFEAIVRELGGNLLNRLDDLLVAVDLARTEELSLIKISEIPFTISFTTKKLKMVEETVLIAEEAFMNVLPETMRKTYSTELAPKIHRNFDPPTSRNPEPLGLWIARRAYELGWTKIRFPNEPYSGDRSRPVLERIGKKYQWIALEELKARIADNYWIKADYGKPTRTYQCKQDISSYNRIDPTIMPPRKELLNPQETFVGPPPLSMEDVENEDLLNWPFLDDHFENPESWLTGQLDNCQWLIIDWSESVNERQSANNPMDPFRRQVQAFVSLVAHKTSDRKQVVDCFLKDHSQGIDLWSMNTQPEGYLAHEFSLMSQDVIPFWKPGGCDNINIATPIITGLIEDDVDRSIEGNVQYIVPHPRICHSLNISISDFRDTGVWRLPDGQVFLRKLKGRGTPLILNKELFDSWCRSEELEYTWVYIGERTSWVGHHHAKWRRTLGAAWFVDGNLHFRNEQRDK